MQWCRLEPVTVLEVIQRGSEYLSRRGVDSPRLQMELMLAHVLSLPRLKLYLEFERVLSESEAGRMREMVRRRGEREPLQHILGTVNFCGWELAVDRRVLVPRPETELLAERAWQFLEQRLAQTGAAGAVLDLGTGSGCLAIIVAKKVPLAEVHAVDVSAEALEVARANAARHEAKVTFYEGDYFSALAAETRLDLIVSNPPYIPQGDLDQLQPEVRDFDPPLALNGGLDGLVHYRRLASEGLERLNPGGRLMLELGDGQAASVGAIFGQAGWRVEAVDKDYAGMERILVAGHAKD